MKDSEYMRMYMANRRRDLKAIGYCYNCGRRKPEGTMTSLCQDCHKRAKAANAAMHQRWCDNGLCHKCGKAEPAPGYTKCPECLEKMRNYKREYIRRQKDAVQA